MINKEYKFSELTEKILGCAMEVHKALGNGFQEVHPVKCPLGNALHYFTG